MYFWNDCTSVEYLRENAFKAQNPGGFLPFSKLFFHCFKNNNSRNSLRNSPNELEHTHRANFSLLHPSHLFSPLTTSESSLLAYPLHLQFVAQRLLRLGPDLECTQPTRVMSVKNTDSPAPTSYQTPISPWLEVGFGITSPIHCRTFSDTDELCAYYHTDELCAYYHNHCESTCANTLLCFLDVILHFWLLGSFHPLLLKARASVGLV